VAGRYPKPTLLKQLAGNPGHRKLAKEAAFARTTAAPPPDLDAAGLEEWNRVAPALVSAGVLLEPDRAALEGYCRWFSRWRTAMIRLESGRLKAGRYRSVLIEARECSREMRAFQVQLGLTPATRSKVAGKPVENDPDNPFRDI
jgi:P27 family predicted phage terminase small subunit